jgi:hypothetical protein
MEANVLQLSNASPVSETHTLVDRVRKIAAALGGAAVWARASGPYFLLGWHGGDAFARLTALGGGSYGLAFRAAAESGRSGNAQVWEPVLLVDELAHVVELALVGASALPSDA